MWLTRRVLRVKCRVGFDTSTSSSLLVECKWRGRINCLAFHGISSLCRSPPAFRLQLSCSRPFLCSFQSGTLTLPLPSSYQLRRGSFHGSSRWRLLRISLLLSISVRPTPRTPSYRQLPPGSMHLTFVPLDALIRGCLQPFFAIRRCRLGTDFVRGCVVIRLVLFLGGVLGTGICNTGDLSEVTWRVGFNPRFCTFDSSTILAAQFDDIVPKTHDFLVLVGLDFHLLAVLSGGGNAGLFSLLL